MDDALGRLFKTIDTLGLRKNTYIIFMSDNGWMLGEHGFTSKVLPYRPSTHVPLFMHVLTSYTLDFMADNAKREQPFFIWLSYLYPHTPYEVPEPYFSMYKDARLPPLRVEKEGLTAANKPFRQVFHQENNDRLLPFDAQRVEAMRKAYYGMVTLVDDEARFPGIHLRICLSFHLLSYLPKRFGCTIALSRNDCPGLK